MKGQAVKIALSVLVIGGSATYLLAATMSEGPTAVAYFHPADEVIVNPQSFKGQNIRVGGCVKKGTVLQKKGTLEYRFEIRPVMEMAKFPAAKDKSIGVAYTGVVPDNFKDNAQVIAGGHLDDEGKLVATEVTAKCPSKYDANGDPCLKE
jgi:cytochrome c-type biogenesis protein CcmE